MVSDSPSTTENWMLTQYFISKASEIEYSVVKTDKLQGEPHERFRTPGTGLRIPCQWNLDFGFQSFADSGFLELHYRFRRPRFQTLQAKISRIPQIWFTLHGAIYIVDCIWAWTRDKKTCSNRVHDMTCFAAKHLTAVFDQRVPLVFHFSQLSGIFLAEKQHNCLQKKFFLAKTNQVDNSRLLQTSKDWRQNMSRLHPIRTCFSSRLHA